MDNSEEEYYKSIEWHSHSPTSANIQHPISSNHAETPAWPTIGPRSATTPAVQLIQITYIYIPSSRHAPMTPRFQKESGGQSIDIFYYQTVSNYSIQPFRNYSTYYIFIFFWGVEFEVHSVCLCVCVCPGHSPTNPRPASLASLVFFGDQTWQWERTKFRKMGELQWNSSRHKGFQRLCAAMSTYQTVAQYFTWKFQGHTLWSTTQTWMSVSFQIFQTAWLPWLRSSMRPGDLKWQAVDEMHLDILLYLIKLESSTCPFGVQQSASAKSL